MLSIGTAYSRLSTKLCIAWAAVQEKLSASVREVYPACPTAIVDAETKGREFGSQPKTDQCGTSSLRN
jgi:hypothetical protein